MRIASGRGLASDEYLPLLNNEAPSPPPGVSMRIPSQTRGSPVSTKVRKLEPRTAPARLEQAPELSPNAVREISAALNALLADTFALYLKTKNFHWHVSGPHFRDYHLLLDEQAEQIFGATDDIAERVRKIGGTTIRSIGHIANLQT